MKIIMWHGCQVYYEHEVPGTEDNDTEVGIDLHNKVLDVEDEYNVTHILEWSGNNE